MLNQYIFNFLHSLANRSDELDLFIVFIARYFQYFVLFFVLYFLVFHIDLGVKSKNKLNQKLKEVTLVFSSGIISLIFVNFLKIFFSAPRPFDLGINDFSPLFIYSDFGSFPSGHAMFFSALAMSLYLIHPKVGRILFAVAVLISLSRVISGVHFPVDIFWGFVLGILTTYLFFRYIYKIFK